ncbi:MAG: sulfite exporter TauE/SafE family protein, partial [bacterium]
GMGYGTTLTPILIILGFNPLQIVPCILLSEFISGISAGLLHHHAGNVNLSKGTKAHKSMLILAACSIAGTIVAVILALKLPKMIVQSYIGVMILLIGIFVLYGKRFSGKFSYKKIFALGTIAAFNKGISGGGYGPLVTGGQVLIGVPEKSAIGITSFAEGIVCFVGLILYIAFSGLPYWELAIPLTLGAALSVPLATWTVKILPEQILRKSIGYATVFLGLLMLLKIF